MGERVRIARLLRGMTQADLARELSVSPAFLCQLEAGTKQPGELFLEALASYFKVTPSFFSRVLTDAFQDEECFFRRRRTTPLYARNRVLAHGTLFAELVAALETRVEMPADSVPAVSVARAEDVEGAAEHCRAQWGLGADAPIKNMLRVVERAGVVVTRFDGGTEKIDAFSRTGARRVIVLSSEKSAYRSRFDLAHECGHLVMHVGLDATAPELERQADAFASALLLPRRGFVPEFPRRDALDWDALLALKARWGVSVAAIVRRAYDLKLIDALSYQRAYKYMSINWRGRRHEPLDDDLLCEEPELVPRALDALASAGISSADLATELGWSPAMFEMVSNYPCPDLPEDITPIASARPRGKSPRAN